MADDPESPPANGSESGKNKLIIILAVVNLLVVLGAAVAVVLVMSQQGAAADEPPQAQGSGVEPLGTLLILDGLVVNLDEADGTHYLRASFQIELDDAEREAEVTARMVPIRSALMLYLSGLQLEDTQGEEKRREILERVAALANEQLGAELVRRAYLTEFVAQ